MLDLGVDRGDTRQGEVEQWWRRSTMHGVSASMSMAGRPTADVDDGSPLVEAATAALREATHTIAGLGYTFILGDRDGRVVRRFGGDARSTQVFDDLSVHPGVSFREEEVGANAIGTALELRRPVVVRAAEHFNENLKLFHCLGHPIVHPVTHRVVGVLDLTGLQDVAHPLVVALMRTVVADIQSRLLDVSKASARRLLTAFQVAARAARPVVAVGEDLLLANRRAVDLFESHDIAMLRGLVTELPDTDGSRHVDVTLSTGTQVRLTVHAVAGEATTGNKGAVLSADITPRRPAISPGNPSVDDGALSPTTLVSGPPGSGRSTAARRVAGSRPGLHLDAAEARTDGADWERRLRAAMTTDGGIEVVCVDDLDLMPEPLVAVLVELARRQPRPDLVVTSLAADQLTGRAAVFASMCTHHERLVPLARRRHEIPALAHALLSAADPGGSRRLTPRAVEALCAHTWPGNLTELDAVMRHVVARRSCGDIALDDLPERYRTTPPPRAFGALEQAERDAILAALTAYDGNKTRVAGALGISRTTLYARMRQLRIYG